MEPNPNSLNWNMNQKQKSEATLSETTETKKSLDVKIASKLKVIFGAVLFGVSHLWTFVPNEQLIGFCHDVLTSVLFFPYSLTISSFTFYNFPLEGGGGGTRRGLVLESTKCVDRKSPREEMTLV